MCGEWFPESIGSEPIWKVTLSSPIELHLYIPGKCSKTTADVGSTGASPQVAGAAHPLVDRAAHLRTSLAFCSHPGRFKLVFHPCGIWDIPQSCPCLGQWFRWKSYNVIQLIPSGFHSHITMENHQVSWEHPLFLWSFSIAMLVITNWYLLSCCYQGGYGWLPGDPHFHQKVITLRVQA